MEGGENIYGIIMVGGKGERLKPYTNENEPKQLLPIETEKTLIQKTYERIKQSIIPESNVFFATNKELKDPINNLLPECLIRQLKQSKNTPTKLFF